MWVYVGAYVISWNYSHNINCQTVMTSFFLSWRRFFDAFSTFSTAAFFWGQCRALMWIIEIYPAWYFREKSMTRCIFNMPKLDFDSGINTKFGNFRRLTSHSSHHSQQNLHSVRDYIRFSRHEECWNSILRTFLINFFYSLFARCSQFLDVLGK